MSIWLVFHGAILTNDQQVMRHIATSADYDTCAGRKEKGIHVLRDFIKSRVVWIDLLEEQR